MAQTFNRRDLVGLIVVFVVIVSLILLAMTGVLSTHASAPCGCSIGKKLEPSKP